MMLQKSAGARPLAASRGSGRALVVVTRATQAGQRSSSREAGQQTFKNQLEALKSMSVVVADTGEPALVKKYRPQDCTTNPRCVDCSNMAASLHASARHPFESDAADLMQVAMAQSWRIWSMCFFCWCLGVQYVPVMCVCPTCE